MAVINQENAVSETNAKIGSRISMTGMILLVVLVGMLGFWGLNLMQKNSMLEENVKLDQEIASLMQEQSLLQEQKVDVSKNATDALSQIREKEIVWSQVIRAVNQLVPKNSQGRPKINFLSFSGTGDGRLNLSASTFPSVDPAFADVAQLLTVFNNNVYFKDAFIPSLSIGKDRDGLSTLTFVFNVAYEAPKLEDVNLNSESQTADESDDSAAKVPRN